MNKAVLLLGLALLLVVFTACERKDQDEESAEEAPAPTGEVTDLPDTLEDTVTLEMNNFAYSLETIPARAGETLRINLVSTGGVHDFVIDELDVSSGSVSGGESTVIEVSIPEDTPAGERYEFYCSIGNHRALGMVGHIEVTE